MSFDNDIKLDFDPEDFFKISSLQIELYLPPEENVEFSTSILINHPKNPVKNATIIELPNVEKKHLYIRQITQEISTSQNLAEKEISVSSFWIKSCIKLFFFHLKLNESKHEIRHNVQK